MHLIFFGKKVGKKQNLADEDDDLLIEDSTSLAIWIITIGEYEIRHNILEKKST